MVWLCSMFDIVSSPEVPETTFSLTASSAGSFSQSMLDDDAVVSFSIGGPSEDSDTSFEPLTLYYVFQNGDVYALCPVVPCHRQDPYQNCEVAASSLTFSF